MSLPKFSVRNSLLINLISIFILLIGAYALFNIQREAFPQVDYDFVTVTTVYAGAPAEDVEKFVTIPVEKEIKSVSGIEEMTSKSQEGVSVIEIQIDPESKDKSKVVDDIQRALELVEDLPEDAEDPIVFELTTREIPIIEISLSGDVPEVQRRLYAELLEDRFLDIKGVAKVNRFGWRDREFWVEVDPAKLVELHVSLDEVIAALRTQNITVPGGPLRTEFMEFNIRTIGEFKTVEEIADVIIRANDAGNWLKVKDVAVVQDTFEESETQAKVNGERATAMVVVKHEHADALKVVKQVKKVIAEFRSTLPPGMEITVTNDFSYYIERRLGVLTSNGIFGFFLVVITLFLFLDPIPAFFTALGVPTALFMTFWAMSGLGMTINLVSMLGLILVLGMLVDDGIIISENVYRLVEEGMDPKEAAVKGTEDVMRPVTFTILTTFAAFIPLMFMKGIIGKFIIEIPIVVMLALAASLIEAFVILPSHLSDTLHYFYHQKKVKVRPWFEALRRLYQRTLNFCLDRRYLVLLTMTLTFFFALWIAKTQMKFILFAGEGIEYFWVRAEAPQGTPLAKMEELLAPVEKLVKDLPDVELDSFRTYIGGIESERGVDPNARKGTHLAQISVFLTPMQKRDRTPNEISEAIREKFSGISGFDKLYVMVPKEGPPRGHDIEIAIKGESFEMMQQGAQRFLDYLKGRKGVSDLSTSYNFGKKQMKVDVDEELAKKYYLTVGQIAATVRQVFKGGMATSIKPLKAEEEIDVLVRYPEKYRNNPEVFEQISIPNQFGNLIKLSSVAKVREEDGIDVINHLDGKRVVYVTGQVDNRTVTSLEINQELQKQFNTIAQEIPGVHVIYRGEFEEQMESFKGLVIAFLFSLFFIFILLVAEFKSLLQPFIVMIAIPFGIIGVILSFWVHDMILPGGRPLNFFALMGLVGLTGIVVNDSIVLVDFIDKLRVEGKSRRESILAAGTMRLRPILMTSITTIGGLISIAYGIGGGDPFLNPMALAIVWGLTFATLLTLIGIPCLYAAFDDLAMKFLHRGLVRKTSN